MCYCVINPAELKHPICNYKRLKKELHKLNKEYYYSLKMNAIVGCFGVRLLQLWKATQKRSKLTSKQENEDLSNEEFKE